MLVRSHHFCDFNFITLTFYLLLHNIYTIIPTYRCVQQGYLENLGGTPQFGAPWKIKVPWITNDLFFFFHKNIWLLILFSH